MVAEADDRPWNIARPVRLTLAFTRHAEGSVLIECGLTKVICTASVEEKIPSFLRGSGLGWVTGEYGMLPRSTGSRMHREASRGRMSGRTQEIQRLIGRSLRAVVDRKKLGERSIWIDCDVIQADGGTRTASISGAYVALSLAVDWMLKQQILKASPLIDFLGAISVGIVAGKPHLDLSYVQDSSADVDMNIVMTGSGHFVEVQGTAEGVPFSRQEFQDLLELAQHGIHGLILEQAQALRQHLGEIDHLFQPETLARIENPVSHD